MTFQYTKYQRNQFLSLNKLEKYCKPDTYTQAYLLRVTDYRISVRLVKIYTTIFKEKTSPNVLNANNVFSKTLIIRQLNKAVFFTRSKIIT
jgi:hypothetical protein